MTMTLPLSGGAPILNRRPLDLKIRVAHDHGQDHPAPENRWQSLQWQL